MSKIVRTKTPGEAWATSVEPQGGDLTLTPEEFTTDPDSFTFVEEFDVGVPAIVYGSAEITAGDPDGETFGFDPGQISAFPNWEVSPDGLVWANATALVAHGANQSSVVGFSYAQVFATIRFGRITVSIVDSDFNPYVGPNHPTVTGLMVYGVLTLGSQLE